MITETEIRKAGRSVAIFLDMNQHLLLILIHSSKDKDVLLEGVWLSL